MLRIQHKRHLVWIAAATTFLFVSGTFAPLGMMVRKARAQEGPSKRVGVFVIPSSPAEAKAALLLNRLLRENTRGMTGIELITPAPVVNAGALPELENIINEAYQSLNARRVDEALAGLNRARPIMEQILPVVPLRLVSLFYKAWGVAQVLKNNMPEAQAAFEISLMLWGEQNVLEYAYSVEALKLFQQVAADMERRSGGNVQVSSVPENAVAVVDAREPVLTPSKVTNLVVGTHLVKVVLDGYNQWAGFTNVKPGDATEVAVTLTPIPEKARFDEGLVGVAKVIKKTPEEATPALLALKEFLGVQELLVVEVSVIGETYEVKGFHVNSDSAVLPTSRALSRDANFLATVREFLSGLFESFYELGKKAEGLGGPPLDPELLQKAGVTEQSAATVFDPDNPVFPTIDRKKKKDSITDKWWFWVGIGVLVAGGVAGGLALATAEDEGKGPTGTVEIKLTNRQ